MIIRKQVILQFMAATFLVILVVSLVLGLQISRRMTSQTLLEHVKLFPIVIDHLAEHHPAIYNFLDSGEGQDCPAEVKSLLERIRTLGDVFRIKIWNREGTIIWSDQKEMIDDNFMDYQRFQTAIAGMATYEISKADSHNTLTEQGLVEVLEIYAPIKKNGDIVGVIELYEAADDLFWRLQKNNWLVWCLVSGAGIIIYVFLFIIFFSAQRRFGVVQEKLLQTQDVTISALAHQAELRDMETGKHLDRTSAYVKLLAEELREFSPYGDYLTDQYIRDLVRAAPLHDIGKIGITDTILNKPGKLDAGEFEIMKKHCEFGFSVLRAAESRLAFRSFLALAKEIARSHHEKWNGKGYPDGLAAEDIPLSARIMAVVDVYDALRSKRCYKEAYDHQISRDIILAEKGEAFDPLVVEAFSRREQDIIDISNKLTD